MTKERFAEILRKHSYRESLIEEMWATRPGDDIDEARLRETLLYFVRNAPGQVLEFGSGV